MAYEHGVRVLEQATSVLAPVTGTAGLQVVFGTAPVNLAADPYGVTNKPILANSWEEAVTQLGYSSDFKSYTLCQSMYASFKLVGVAPVIFVNVLDPNKHKKTNDPATVNVVNLEAVTELDGVLLDTVKVKKAADDETELTEGTDYVLSFNDDGKLVVTLLPTGTAAKETSVKVESDSIDPTDVKAADIVGTSSGGTEKGLEVLRQVYPKFGMTPGLLIAPGWSHDPDVGIVLAAKCEEINGYFGSEGYVDIDSTDEGCKVYTDVKTYKEKAGVSSPHVMALWPCVQIGSMQMWASAYQAALTAYIDASNDDVPSLSPSNKAAAITGTVLADGTEVMLDQTQGNTVNSFGVSTFINVNGWRTWGNNTAAYPAVTDPKDRWFCCRRYFTWRENGFILTFFQKVDDPTNYRLVETIVDSANIEGNSYVASGKCAADYIQFNEAENPVTSILDGKIRFHHHLAPYTPAEDILNVFEFDPDALMADLNGGN